MSLFISISIAVISAISKIQVNDSLNSTWLELSSVPFFPTIIQLSMNNIEFPSFKKDLPYIRTAISNQSSEKNQYEGEKKRKDSALSEPNLHSSILTPKYSPQNQISPSNSFNINSEENITPSSSYENLCSTFDAFEFLAHSEF
ncbi:hypothetical protein HMI55_005565 [Coelomomyces lativittatus]|nr:hypothetical protein HMI55_005565 [Coelomomyces lativittatus]